LRRILKYVTQKNILQQGELEPRFSGKAPFHGICVTYWYVFSIFSPNEFKLKDSHVAELKQN